MKNLSFAVLCVFMAYSAYSDSLSKPGMGNRLDVESTWIGNSLPGSPAWIPHNVADIFVTSDGKVITNVPWEEGGGNVQLFDRDGKWLANADLGNWGGGMAVAANDRHVYFSAATKRKVRGLPPQCTGIERRRLNNIADFEDRRFAMTAPERKKNLVTGIAVGKDRVYAAIAELNEVRVYDLELKQLSSWPVEAPAQMAFDGQGHLWIVGQDSGRVRRYTVEGKLLKQSITLPAGSLASDVCIDSKDRLYVGDVGPREQIHVFNDIATKPVPLRSIGEPGGVFNGVAGRHGPKRFFHVAGIGLDQGGNLYVASAPGKSGTTLLQSYDPNGRLRWEQMCMVWIDAPGFDPTDPNTMFTAHEKFRIDLSKPRGKQWMLTAHTLDPHRYPDDPRIAEKSGSTWMRRIDGHLLQFVVPMNGNQISIFRFDSEQAGELAIPAGFINYTSGWIDLNGDGRIQDDERTELEPKGSGRGWWVDSTGTIWWTSEKNGICCYGLDGFTPQGVPRYGLKDRQESAMPEPFQKLRRIRFYPERGNLMMLSGFTEEHPDTKWHWKRAGPAIRFYTDWKPGQWNFGREIVPPYESERFSIHGDANMQTIELVDDYLFIARSGWSKTMDIGRGHVDIFDYRTGKPLGWVEQPEYFGPVGLMDMTESMSVQKTPDGTYYIWLEDDHYGKIYAYIWNPN